MSFDLYVVQLVIDDDSASTKNLSIPLFLWIINGDTQVEWGGFVDFTNLSNNLETSRGTNFFFSILELDTSILCERKFFIIDVEVKKSV